MNNYPDQDIASVGFLGFVGGAVGGLWSLVNGGSSESQYLSHGKGELSQIIQNIDVQARHRAALLSMQQEPAIRQFLLDFITSGPLTLSEMRDDKKDAYKGMKLGIKLLSTVLVCGQKKEEKEDFFEAYYETLKYLTLPSYESQEKRAADRRQLNTTAQRILKVLETEKDEPLLPSSTRKNKKYKKCEEKTFLKFYETSLGKKITGEHNSEANSFLEAMSEMSQPDYSMAVGPKEQRRFFEYHRAQLENKGNKESKKRAQDFEKDCLKVFKYEPHALKDAKHQALCDAAGTDAETLKKFLAQYGQEINLNQRFIRFTQEPVDEADKDAAKNNDDNSATETVLFKVIRERRDTEVIRVLCDKGADVELRDSTAFQRTALHFAVAQGVFSVLSTLIEKKADPCLYDARGCTSLSNVVDKINEHFRESYHHRYGFEALSAALWDKFYAPMRCLASKNTVNQKDKVSKDKSNAAYDKAFHGEFLIEGATPAFKFIVYLFRLLNIEAESKALLEAIETDPTALSQNRHVEEAHKTKHGIQNFMNLFMKNGADLNATDHLGDTLLHYLIKSRQGYGGLVMTQTAAAAWVFFLRHQATMVNPEIPLHEKIPFNKKNNEGKTPIELAHQMGWSNFAQVMQRLLDASMGSQPAAIDDSKPDIAHFKK